MRIDWLHEQVGLYENERASLSAQPLSGLIALERGDSAPLTRQLYEQLRSAIADGRLRHGYRLASSRMLAEHLGVSRNTVAAAVDQLANEGYLDVARGRRPSIAAGLVLLSISDAAGRRAGPAARQRLSGGAQHSPARRQRTQPPGAALDRSGLALAGRKDRPRLIFVTPSHQYPTGKLMPVDRRLELLRFAKATGAVLIEDDYDSEFHYDGRPIASLQGLDGAGRVFYVGTFSKVTLADIRVGYTVVPESLVGTFEIAQRHTGQLVSAALQDALSVFMEDGAYAAHIRRVTRVYRARRDRLVQALSAETRDTFMVDPPAGGMQLLARCRLRQNDRFLCTRLAEAGVTARPLSSHYVGKATERGLFLGFAAWTDPEIDAGARLIGRVCAR
jgi:DNA-binding transcriptional MocR family regulator